MTVSAYLSIPEEAPYLELVDGEVIEKAMPDEDHGAIIEAVAMEVGPYRRLRGGMSGTEIRSGFEGVTDMNFRLPDYSYWAPERQSKLGRWNSPPTLAVEVRSPDETMASQRAKCRWFRSYGVDGCWLIDPGSRTVEVFEGDRDGVIAESLLESPFLPGLQIPVESLFSGLAPS